MIVHTGLAFGALNLLVIASVVAGAGVSVWISRRNEARTLARVSLSVSLAFVLFCLVDWTLLQALPLLRLSFSPSIGLSLTASVFARLALLGGLLAATALTHWRGQGRSRDTGTRAAVLLFLAANLGLSLAQVDAYVVEPLLVETTELSLVFDELDDTAPPVRIVHLTDIHVERSSHREATVLRQVQALQPDIIVLTGDYVNLSYLWDSEAVAHFRQFVEQLEAPYGVYAVRGSVEPVPELMVPLVEGTQVTWLEQDAVTVEVRGQPVTLVGVACSHQQEVDAKRLTQAMEGVPASALTVLLYHSPDLIQEAAGQGVDLYLSGHTHGGQLRLPLYGAIVTSSRYGKTYASGLFEEGDTTLYVSRGLGFEGGSMPRARFLCRPEMVSIELRGTGSEPRN